MPNTCWIFELCKLTFPTIFKPRVDQVLGDLQQLVPVLVHDPANLRSSLKVETPDPPVVPGGPPAAADEQEDDEEDDQVDGGGGKGPDSPVCGRTAYLVIPHTKYSLILKTNQDTI